MTKKGQNTSVKAENIGGINNYEIAFSEGVTILEGRNATNRTSLLRAIAGVLGGGRTQVKSDTDEGHVQMSLNGETYTRYYSANGETTRVEGTPYSDKTTLIDLFVLLTDDNPVRQTVRGDGDLREQLMKPLDTDEIQASIQEKKGDRQQLDDEIAEIEQAQSKLSGLTERKVEIEEELEEIETEIESTKEAAEQYEADEEEAERAEDLVKELKELRQTRNETRRKLDHQKSELSELRNDLTQARSELADLEIPEQNESEIQQEIDSLQREKREIETEIDDLTRVIEFNRDLLSSGNIPGDDSEDAIVSGLDPNSETVECWTCGSNVQQQEIKSRLEGLRDIVQQKRQKRSGISEEIDTLSKRRRSLEQSKERKQDCEHRVKSIEQKIDHREQLREDLEAELTEIKNEEERLEQRVNETEHLRDNDIVETYRQISQLEYERGQLNQELKEITQEIERIEQRGEKLAELREQREKITNTIETLRSKVEDTERELVDEFNTHMEDILNHLEFNNIERVWIERQNTSRNTTFELHVIREAASGSVYEDTVNTLSESEREVIGLIVGLTGYLVYDVDEEIPFILLDSIEAIDEVRINRLVDYFREYANYILVALLPEDAAMVDYNTTQVSGQTLSV